jgi:hypothetical protein
VQYTSGILGMHYISGILGVQHISGIHYVGTAVCILHDLLTVLSLLCSLRDVEL